MKKTITILSILIVSIMLITGCSTKTSLDSTDFVDLIEQNGYKTTNVKDQFKEFPQI